MNSARAIRRSFGFVALCLAEAVEWLLLIALPGRRCSLSARAGWLHRFCRRLVRLLGYRPTYGGDAPRGGLLVSNHLSYLDVIVLAARAPLVFVAKRELRGWPGLGLLIGLSGTIFIDRGRRNDVTRAGSELEAALEQGVTVCLFAEGTSSDGATVLPFRSSLLAPAVNQGCRATRPGSATNWKTAPPPPKSATGARWISRPTSPISSACHGSSRTQSTAPPSVRGGPQGTGHPSARRSRPARSTGPPPLARRANTRARRKEQEVALTAAPSGPAGSHQEIPSHLGPSWLRGLPRRRVRHT